MAEDEPEDATAEEQSEPDAGEELPAEEQTEIDVPSAEEELEEANEQRDGPEPQGELDSFLQHLDVIPDDIAIVGNLDDSLIRFLDELEDDARAQVALEVGSEHDSPEAIARAVVENYLRDEETVSKVATLLDELIPLPPGLEAIDGPIINFLASRAVDKLADELIDAVS